MARTGVIGIIAITGWEKFKGGTRVEFLCGGRALGRIREWRDVFSATSRVLSVLPSGLAAAIERLQGENKALGRTVREMQEQLAGHVASTRERGRPRVERARGRGQGPRRLGCGRAQEHRHRHGGDAGRVRGACSPPPRRLSWS